ncbi:MAG: hypothetical protein IIB40_09415 [Candidatus Marinimicrobia bacterium]|nr:hypothetical protein [Candidatus Neomarinimicrobiota bacterium]
MQKYSFNERLEIISYAKENGIKSTVLNFGTNRNTISRWLKRYDEGKPLLAYVGYHPSEEEKQMIIGIAMKLNQFTLREIQKCTGIKCSLSTIYRILSIADIPLRKPFIIDYHCKACDSSFNTVAAFYGAPHKLSCPDCGDVLKKVSSKVIPFYYPNNEDYLLRNGVVLKITNDALEEIEPLLEIPVKGIPVFIRQTARKQNYQVHIVMKYVNQRPLAHCGAGRRHPHTWEVFNNITRRTKVKDICRKCLLKSIDHYNKTKDLAPFFEMIEPTKLQRKFKMLKDSASMKNISLACKINGYSRPTYYSAKREFGEIA